MGICLFPFGGLVSCVQTFLGVSTAVYVLPPYLVVFHELTIFCRSCCIFTLGGGLQTPFNAKADDSRLWDDKSQYAIL